jgi:deoxyadenosine/deoxycytidine kinase
MMRRYEQAWEQTKTDQAAVFERSMKVAAEVFIELNKDVLTAVDFTLLQEYCHVGQRLFEDSSKSKHVYLTCTEQTMLNRVFQRDRKAEKYLR